jgi:hypothetical protein
MTPFSRFLLRLRRFLLRCYELGMFALLLAVAGAAFVPSAEGRAEAAAAAADYCGKAQSSAIVMSR